MINTMSQSNVAPLIPDTTSCVRIDLSSILLRRSNHHHHHHQQQQQRQWNEQILKKKNDSVKDSCITLKSHPSQKHRIDSTTTNDEATVHTSKFVSDPIFFPICAPSIPLRNHVSILENQAIHRPSIPPTQPQRCQSITVDLVTDADDYCYDTMVSSPPIQPQRYQSIDATGMSCIDHKDYEDNDDDVIYGKKAPPLPLPNRFAHLSLPPSQPQRIQSIDLSDKKNQQIPHHQYQNQQQSRLSLVVEESLEFSMTWMNASISANNGVGMNGGMNNNDSVNIMEHENTPYGMRRQRRQQCNEREEKKRMFISDSALSGISLKHSKGQPKCWSTTMINCSFDDDNSSVVSDFTDDESFDHNDDQEENCEVYKRRGFQIKDKKKFLSFPSHNGLTTSPSRISLASIVPRRRSTRQLYNDTLEK